MFDLFEMVRPLNCLMALIGVLVGGLIVSGSALQNMVSVPMLMALVAALLIAGAGNVFNDYTDVEADKVNRPKRPIPSGKVSKNSALVFSIILFALGITLAGFINWVCFAIAVINSAVLVIYSITLQDKLFLGNIGISYLVGSVFLFGGAALGNIILPFILMVLAGLATFSREIVKDLEDIEGDRRSFLKRLTSKITIPIAERFGITTRGVDLKYKEKYMVILAMSSLGVAIIFSVLPYYYGILKLSYLAIVILADIIFLSCIYSLGREKHRKKGYRRISRRMKFGMLLALIAFVVGALI